MNMFTDFLVNPEKYDANITVGHHPEVCLRHPLPDCCQLGHPGPKQNHPASPLAAVDSLPHLAQGRITISYKHNTHSTCTQLAHYGIHYAPILPSSRKGQPLVGRNWSLKLMQWTHISFLKWHPGEETPTELYTWDRIIKGIYKLRFHTEKQAWNDFFPIKFFSFWKHFHCQSLTNQMHGVVWFHPTAYFSLKMVQLVAAQQQYIYRYFNQSIKLL